MGVLRFLLALSVISSHAGPLFGLPLLQAEAAVQIFFAISGFYMALILDGKYRDLSIFYSNRILRLYPTYLIIILLYWAWFLVSWVHIGHLPRFQWIDEYEKLSWIARILIALSNWSMIGLDVVAFWQVQPDRWVFHTIAPAWSLGCEIWFYLLAPFLTKLSIRWLVGIALASFAVGVAMNESGLAIFQFFPAQLWFFVCGILLYRCYKCVPFIRTPPPLLASVSACMVAITIVLSLRRPETFALYFDYVAIIPMIPILFAATRSSKIDAIVGHLSYPMYLSHPLVTLVLSNVTHAAFHSSAEPSGAIVAAATIGFSILIYFGLERPIDGFRQQRAASSRLGQSR